MKLDIRRIADRFLSEIPHRFLCDECDWIGFHRGVTKEGRRKVHSDARRHRLWGCYPDLEWVGRNVNRFDLLGMRQLVRQTSRNKSAYNSAISAS